MVKMRDTLRSQGYKPILIPLNSDILCGKGKPFQLHVGNLMMQNLVEGLLSEYNSRTKAGKTRLIHEIVQKLNSERGSRFLAKDLGVWMEVSDDIATSKVSQLFRSRKTAKQTKTEPTTATEKRLRLMQAASTSEGKRARIDEESS